MNRSDFLRSLVVGAAIAPTILMANPKQDITNEKILNAIHDGHFFTADDINIYNDWSEDYYEDKEHPKLIGRSVSFSARDVQKFQEKVDMFFEKEAHNFCIRFKDKYILFTGIISQISGSPHKLDLSVTCTNPNVSLKEI